MVMCMINHVVFDFDGVIIDSHNVQIKALNKSYIAVVGEGKPPIEEFFKHSGNSLENIFPKLGLPLEMIPIYRRVSEENMDLIRIHEGMRTLLEELNQRNITCSLCTGKERKRTMAILRKFDLDKYFKTVVCSDDIVKPKPDPEGLLLIKNTHNIENDNIIMVGDGINDILAAKKTGICVIAVTWGDSTKEMLCSQSPDYLCERVQELKNVLLKGNVV